MFGSFPASQLMSKFIDSPSLDICFFLRFERKGQDINDVDSSNTSTSQVH
uniref:Uncharacterized protein n=1 Tax=Manihot esculenta TaxID=3983 RepID=A0A2C9W5A2_MANES